MINLVRDVLDNLLVDRNDRCVGRVDGIVLELRKNRPPKVVAIEMSAATLGHRIHPLAGRIAAALASRLGAEPVRLPISTIRNVGVDIDLDVDAERDPRLLKFEKWLSRTIIRKIPGGAK
jgi:hypothetical protein